ncbi:MAG: ribosome silencing factor [Chloroflexota bacterium]
MSLNTVDSQELAHLALDAIAEKMGLNTVILDIRPVSLLGDYFVICSGESDRQIQAIVDEIRFQVKKQLGIIPLRIEGTSASGWMLMDYGGVIVHIFSPATRDYYQLEALWSDAPVVVKMQ